jgi:uncharacterized protein YjbI with pentapeptide repeats
LAARGKSLEARALRFVCASAFSLAALWLSIVIAIFPSEPQEEALAWMNPRWFPNLWSEDKRLTAWISLRDLLFTGEVDLTTQRRSSPFSNTLVLPGFSLYEGLKIDDPKKLEWKEYRADLRGRHLEEAMLSKADLSRADLTGARIQGALLQGAQLKGVSLDDARLQGAVLEGAHLEAASLDRAQLQGASLTGAQLEGASLEDAQLQGASLFGTQLDGVSLKGAHLEAASLEEAQLQGAVLDGADIEAANFSGSFLWRTLLANLKFGAIVFQKVKWGVIDWVTTQDFVVQRLCLKSSYKWHICLPDLPAREMRKYYPELAELMDEVGGTLGKEAKQRVGRLDCKTSGKNLASCDPKKKLPPEASEWLDKLNKANTADAAFQKAVAAILKKISCAHDGDAIYVLRGLVGASRLDDLKGEAIALVDSILKGDCPVSSSLPDKEIVALLWIRGDAYARQKNFDHAIDDYTAAIKFVPENKDLYNVRGAMPISATPTAATPLPTTPS